MAALSNKDLTFLMPDTGLPWWLNVRVSACGTGTAGDIDLIPGSGRSPGGGNGNPLQNSSLENLMDRGASWATVHGVTKVSDMT